MRSGIMPLKHEGIHLVTNLLIRQPNSKLILKMLARIEWQARKRVLLNCYVHYMIIMCKYIGAPPPPLPTAICMMHVKRNNEQQ